MKRSIAERVLVGLELFLCAGAVYGGWSLLGDPTGNSLGMPANTLLVGTPFDDYLVPGLVLFTVNGAFPLLVAVATLMRMPMARYGHLAVGLLLTGWMAVQVMLIGLNATIQVVFFLLGLLILALGAMVWAESAPPRSGGRFAHSH
jgi:hypothetical protein